MEEIIFKVREEKEFTIINFDLEDVIEPEVLKKIKPPKVNDTRGVILSGRGPIWIYSFLVHYYHPSKFIATYDPRLGGAVIVESHNKKYKVGETIKVKIDED